jgi:hypothetical protein
MADEKNAVITTFASSSATTLTQQFGPKIWKAPELPVERLPDNHPVYNLLGRLASDWSHVEHTLDTIIWANAPRLFRALANPACSPPQSSFSLLPAILPLATVKVSQPA